MNRGSLRRVFPSQRLHVWRIVEVQIEIFHVLVNQARRLVGVNEERVSRTVEKHSMECKRIACRSCFLVIL
jgi:hypothetical protein